MATRKDFRKELETKLTPALESLGFSRSPWKAADGFRKRHFPLGRFSKLRDGTTEVILIQVDKHGGAKFVLNFGIIPESGVQARSQSFSRDQAFETCVFAEGGRLYSRPHSIRWFGPSWLRSIFRMNEEPSKVVDHLVSLLPEVEDWFKSRSVGPHVQIKALH
jgi:hypothetical protein